MSSTLYPNTYKLRFMWDVLSERIKFVIKDAGVSPADLGRITGATSMAVSQWINGPTREIKGKYAFRISRQLGYNPEWLLTGAEPVRLGISEPKIEYATNVEMGPAFAGQVPLISWVTAGEADMAIDLLPPGDAEEWVPGPPVSYSKSTYVLKVKGDSMTAPFGKSYPDGCLIYVDPEQRGGVVTGDRIIAKINGQDAVTFKQLAEDSGRMFLKPLNPQYPAIHDEFRVLGKIIFKGEPE